jgi:hypothetical protein
VCTRARIALTRGGVSCSQRPGKPSLVTVDTTCGTRCLKVTVNPPVVPFQGVFCGGGGTLAPTVPAACPLTMGSGTQADGGSPIQEYKVQWSVVYDFSFMSPPDNGEALIGAATIAAGAPYVISLPTLTSGLLHYVRVAAVNGVGIGDYCQGNGILCDGATLEGTPA